MKHRDSTQKSRSRRPGNPGISSEVCCQKTIKSSIDSLTYQFFAESLSVIQKKKHPKVVITPHKTDFWTSTFACRLDHQSQIFGLKSHFWKSKKSPEIPRNNIPTAWSYHHLLLGKFALAVPHRLHRRHLGIVPPTWRHKPHPGSRKPGYKELIYKLCFILIILFLKKNLKLFLTIELLEVFGGKSPVPFFEWNSWERS